jgi:hypothetical protein
MTQKKEQRWMDWHKKTHTKPKIRLDFRETGAKEGSNWGSKIIERRKDTAEGTEKIAREAWEAEVEATGPQINLSKPRLRCVNRRQHLDRVYLTHTADSELWEPAATSRQPAARTQQSLVIYACDLSKKLCPLLKYRIGFATLFRFLLPPITFKRRRWLMWP